ncbi:hypothetical protein CC78DRAFT_530482 [Lojkania enalia]|uniref:Mediator of RNA polymerase II transcription subunit 17 n=1 Tax=Lojkania enalia TaxID=147567 RepID=A0A9P4KH91_9PLEO|nr:hypothetical protein CC78DRAFT_530482 [Didymosphaeria enalia]
MSGARAGTVSDVALRPWPAPTKETLDRVALFNQVHQLTTERGHLRFVTEKTLQEEIDAGKDASEDVMEGVEQEDQKPAPTKQERLQEVARAQHDMFTKVEWATFYANNTLDLIALLLSKDPAKMVDKSFSQQFKEQQIPRGSFGLDKGNAPKIVGVEQAVAEIQAAEDNKRRMAGRGSTMKALDWSTEKLLEATEQVKTEARKEAAYWEEILSISQKGWSIQRSRKDARHAPYAVRYGFPEASQHFKSRGFAPLRMDKDGSIILDPALALQPKTLRVRISENRKIVGTSTLPTQVILSGSPFERSIQLAKDSLFEEELYHEITLESRQLLAAGVELRDSVINVLVPDLSGSSMQQEILIDCIPREENASNTENTPQTWLAHNVAEALRILLAHEHHLRLFRRSQIPPTLTQAKRPPSHPPLLRTLIATFRHLHAVDSLQRHLDLVVKILDSAGLKASTKTIRESSWNSLAKIIKESRRSDMSPVDQLLGFFTKPLDGLATLTLPSSHGAHFEQLTITTRTYIGHPTFGSEHKVALPPSLISSLNLSPDQKREFKFISVEEVKSYLDWIISLDLSHVLLSKEYGNRASIVDQGPKVIIVSKPGKKKAKKTVEIKLENGRLTISAGTTDPLTNDKSAVEQEFTWNGSKESSSFKDKIKSFVG